MIQHIRISGVPQSEFENGYNKALAWFFAFPREEFTLNELQENLGIAKTTANTAVSQLEREGFLEKRVLGRLWRIKANQAHPYFVTRKIPFNLHLVYGSGILDWVNQNIPHARAVILFGSYRKGDDVNGSDLDIAIEVLGNEHLKILKGKIPQLGYRRDVPVSLHVFSRNRANLNVFANIANGIVLKGFLEVRP